MEILEKYKTYLRRNYTKHNTRDIYYAIAKQFIMWVDHHKHKDVASLTKDDALDFKAYCLSHYTQNGNVLRICAFNIFVERFLGRSDLRMKVPSSTGVTKQVLGDDELERYLAAAHDMSPLHYLIAVYQIDGLLRPSEFGILRISRHDIKNQTLYLDDTKTGSGSVILSPRMIEAFHGYMRYRKTPRNEQDQDVLVITPEHKFAGFPPRHMDKFIHARTSQIAVNAGFTRKIYPYLIKPSAITAMFNKQVNPRITQRQARHKRIETTLRYDHTNDEMAKQHFNKTQSRIEVERLSPDDKARVLFDKFLRGEIDRQILNEGLNVLLPGRNQGGRDIAFQ